MTSQPRRADGVFEGGGVKGIGFVGALQAFEEAGFVWQNVAGASAGAITAALVAVGYSAAEVRELMNTRVDFRRFRDATAIGRVPTLGPWLSVVFSNGMYRGDYFLELMRSLLAEKMGKQRVTFGDLILPKEEGDSQEDYEKRYRYRLMVVASDLSSNELLTLPQDAARLGMKPDELEVALAVRMSMSIPYFFRPVVLNSHWIVDGGILSNFPIDLFDSPRGQEPLWPTFGFLLWEPGSDQPPFSRIKGTIMMTKAVIETMANAHNRKVIEDTDAKRLVKIPTGKYRVTDFDLTAADRDWLYNSGYEAARQFLHGPEPWDFDAHKAMRRRAW